MFRKLAILLLVSCSLVSCDPKRQSACGTQACTENFAAISISFADANGGPVTVKNYSAVNQRTKAKLTVSAAYDLMPGAYIVADDSSLKQLSTEGDDVLVTGTHPTTNQTKTATLKISGGCNCHVEKLSGPQTIVFD
jgi:hypothetical protein